MDDDILFIDDGLRVLGHEPVRVSTDTAEAENDSCQIQESARARARGLESQQRAAQAALREEFERVQLSNIEFVTTSALGSASASTSSRCSAARSSRACAARVLRGSSPAARPGWAAGAIPRNRLWVPRVIRGVGRRSLRWATAGAGLQEAATGAVTGRTNTMSELRPDRVRAQTPAGVRPLEKGQRACSTPELQLALRVAVLERGVAPAVIRKVAPTAADGSRPHADGKRTPSAGGARSRRRR